MSTVANKDNKKLAVLNQVKQALAAVRKAQGSLTAVAQALEAMEKACKHLKAAETIAQARPVGDKIHRDALPAPIRHRLERMSEQMERLLDDIRDVPITREQAALQKVARARKRTAKS